MKRFKRNFQTLAIIGNGFDLQHGYKTDYRSFVECTNAPCLEKFKTYCKSEDITTWYLFEENIRILSEQFFLKSMSENCNFDDNRQEVKALTDIFKEIHVLLGNYLTQETLHNPAEKNPCIAKYLNNRVLALNFNYTKTAEIYTKNVVYVHGSLAENDILLGYDYRDEPCLAQFEDMCWSKGICREALAFRRHFLGKKKYKTLVSGLESYQHWENTGRGLEEEVKSFIPEYNTVHKFLTKYRTHLDIPKFSYKKIKTIVILGHGIEADRVFLKNIIEKCSNLCRVVIYRYVGESDESYREKASFFQPYCKDIEQVDY